MKEKAKTDEKNKESKDMSYFISEYKNLQKELSLFQMYFTPLELYILKLFMANPKPKTIRGIQTQTINLIYEYTFDIGEIPQKDAPLNNEISSITKNRALTEMYGTLVEGNYGSKYPQKKKTDKGASYFKDIPPYKEIPEKQKILREAGVKIPSFDLIRSIVKDFEDKGFLIKREKEKGSGLVYFRINPKFYLTFKEKIPEIIKL